MPGRRMGQEIAPAPPEGFEFERRQMLIGQHQQVVFEQERAQFGDGVGVPVVGQVDAFHPRPQGDADRLHGELQVLGGLCHG